MGARRGLLIVLAALLAGALGLAASIAINGPGALAIFGDDDGASVSPGAPALGSVVAPFQLPDFKGAVHRVPVPTKPMLLNYWASWCGPCREELPLLAAYSREADEQVEVIGIALEPAADAAGFLAEQPLPFRILVETPGPSDSSVRLGNPQGVLPFSVLIGADGRLLARRFGPFADAEELREWVAKAR